MSVAAFLETLWVGLEFKCLLDNLFLELSVLAMTTRILLLLLSELARFHTHDHQSNFGRWTVPIHFEDNHSLQRLSGNNFLHCERNPEITL